MQLEPIATTKHPRHPNETTRAIPTSKSLALGRAVAVSRARCLRSQQLQADYGFCLVSRYPAADMPKHTFARATTLGLLLSLSACDDKAPETPKAGDAGDLVVSNSDAKEGGDKAAEGRVFFVKPADGATVPAEFEVEFGVEGKTVRPAGATERDPALGHHHLLVDTSPIPDKTIVPKDEKHIHYGDGSTKAKVKLSPGEHKLTMQFADGAHRSYGEAWSSTITVKVEAAPAEGAPAEGAPADGG